MLTKKPTKKSSRRTGKKAKPKPSAKKAPAKGFTSMTWERVYLMSVELDAFAAGLKSQEGEPEGFDVTDAARELARLALNYNVEANHDGRKLEQEKEDWISVAGIGADLGNIADEQAGAEGVEGVRAIAYELCYLAFVFLF